MMATSFPALLQRFITDRLLQQRHASPHTIASDRDTFRLLLRFAADRLNRAPSTLAVDDLTPTFIGEFLDHLKRTRATAAARGMRDSRRSIRLPTMFRSANRLMPCCVSDL